MSPEDRARLGANLAALGGDELRVLLRISDRLVMGRSQYGELSIARDKRNWRNEIAEEVLDQAVYTAIYLLKEEL